MCIKASRKVALRGQAFITFKLKVDAAAAMSELQGALVFHRPMEIAYARDVSLAYSASTGTLDQHRARLATVQDKSLKQASQKSTFKSAVRGVGDAYIPPSAILFAQDLAVGTTHASLVAIFGAFPGFKEVRLVPGKADIAFIEYQNENNASFAKHSIRGINVSFSKK